MARTKQTPKVGSRKSTGQQVVSAGEAFIRKSQSPVLRNKRPSRGAPCQTKASTSAWAPKSGPPFERVSVDSALEEDSDTTVEMMGEKSGGSDEREYHVDKILDCRVRKEYLVKWTGYKAKTWEPESNLEHCQLALAAYHKTSKAKCE